MNCPFCSEQVLEESPLISRDEIIATKGCKCNKCDFTIHYMNNDIVRIYITLAKNNKGKVIERVSFDFKYNVINMPGKYIEYDLKDKSIEEIVEIYKTIKENMIFQ